MVSQLHEVTIAASPKVLDVGERKVRWGKTNDGVSVTVTGSYDNVNFETVVTLSAGANVFTAIASNHRYYKFTGTPGTLATLISFDPRDVLA